MGIGDLDYSSRDSSFLIPTSLLLIELLLEIDLGKVKVRIKTCLHKHVTYFNVGDDGFLLNSTGTSTELARPKNALERPQTISLTS